MRATVSRLSRVVDRLLRHHDCFAVVEFFECLLGETTEGVEGSATVAGRGVSGSLAPAEVAFEVFWEGHIFSPYRTYPVDRYRSSVGRF